MVEAITRFEPVVIAARSVTDVPLRVREMESVSIFECPTNDTWARDHGAITLVDRDAESSPSVMLGFCFNGWGKKFPADLDNAIARKLWEAGAFGRKMTFEDHDDFVLEGGSIESDGKGTVFTTSQCLMAPNRNQPMGREEIEQELKRRLHAERVVWLDYGNLVGDDTDGHIDTIVRVAPDDTLLYVKCEDREDEQYDDFLALEQQLKSLLTSEGQPYRLIPLPMPAPIYEQEGEERGQRLPATYANFLVINGAVICPVYGQPENDRKALEGISEAFPGREVIPIDSRTIIRQHGSIHCLTMQFPR
jgi:agmatine/peptidylarginine deiminase